MGNSACAQETRACCDKGSSDNYEVTGKVVHQLPGLDTSALDFTVEEPMVFNAAIVEKQETASSSGVKDTGGNGEVTVTCKDGSTYTGQLADGRREGRGLWAGATGSYDGEWHSDQPNGKGRQTWLDGRTYEGEFVDGKFEGRGKMIWNTAQGTMVYEGDYLNDAKHGVGRLVWPDGRVYDGDWRCGKRSGKGIYINKRGERKVALWIDDRFDKWIRDDDMQESSTATAGAT